MLDVAVGVDVFEDFTGQVGYTASKNNQFVVLAHNLQKPVQAISYFGIGRLLLPILHKLNDPLLTLILKSHFPN